MIWEGEEIVENYDVPDSGPARIGTLRPVRWERFYDEYGKAMIGLFRKLVAMRKEEPLFRRGDYFFFNDWQKYQSKGLLLFERSYRGTKGVVALNFSDYDQSVEFTFERGGDYYEQLHGEDNLLGINDKDRHTLHIPSNYGRVWLASENG